MGFILSPPWGWDKTHFYYKVWPKLFVVLCWRSLLRVSFFVLIFSVTFFSFFFVYFLLFHFFLFKFRTIFFEILKKKHGQIPGVNTIQGVLIKKIVKFPLMVLFSTLEFPPTRSVTQFCRVCRGESLFSRST